jgi:hypothetical protein
MAHGHRAGSDDTGRRLNARPAVSADVVDGAGVNAVIVNDDGCNHGVSFHRACLISARRPIRADALESAFRLSELVDGYESRRVIGREDTPQNVRRPSVELVGGDVGVLPLVKVKAGRLNVDQAVCVECDEQSLET